MCFNLAYKIKNGKIVLKKFKNEDEDDDNKALLAKEIERWKKQQQNIAKGSQGDDDKAITK